MSEISSNNYFKPSDLGRFGDIGRSDPKHAEAFFAYYTKVMGEGNALTKREKALCALAVAHALKCPYCIDSVGHSLMEMGVSESEMFESVHVAAAMAAGVTLVHSTQLLGHLDAAAAEHDNRSE